MNHRLDRLERQNADQEEENTTLKSRLNEYSQENQELRDQFAGQNAKVFMLSDELQILRGRLEETEHLVKRKMTALKNPDPEPEKTLVQIERVTHLNRERITRVEQYLNLEPSEKFVTEKISGKPAAKGPSEDEIYTSAKMAFDRGNYDAAREGFQTLIKQYPGSRHADNAQFWLGEIYYREKWYEKAILEYQKVIEQHPKGNKMQAALLKQGFAFYNLGDKANARLILKELIKKFPESTEAEIARKKIEGFTP
ncbi:MAG: tol-pal system protein YbgF [Deltaproteobacteria bacterium]|nr:tol-pal system protein YbgF [Deltaproteobacteria bacterium]